jgi:hypothetical protein
VSATSCSEGGTHGVLKRGTAGYSRGAQQGYFRVLSGAQEGYFRYSRGTSDRPTWQRSASTGAALSARVDWNGCNTVRCTAAPTLQQPVATGGARLRRKALVDEAVRRPIRLRGGSPSSPGADVGRGERSPGADVGGGEPSPGADVRGGEPI